MKKVLTYIGMDDWGRPVYRDQNGFLWKDVDNRRGWLGTGNENLRSSYGNVFDGEPDVSMSNRYEVEFIPRRIVRG